MELAGQLTAAGFSRLFLSGDPSATKAVWADGANRAALEEIVAGRDHDALARLLAAEVLFRHAADFPRSDQRVALGEVYARALRIPSADVPANLWGFLFYGPEDDGPLGEHLLAAGDAAIRELLPLLDDDAPLTYAGSRDATLGNSFHYRVKDAAGYYLGRLTGHTLEFHEELAARDTELARLRAAVSS